MAKKKEKTIEEPVVEETVVVKEQPKVEAPKQKAKDTWEIRDRIYVLANNLEPLTYTISPGNILWFDEEKGYEREITYAPNQTTPFVDEMKGTIRREHIVFKNGSLYVPKNKTILQKFLSLYHPKRNKLYYEVDKKKKAVEEFAYLEYELDAMNLARSLEIEQIEAILRVQVGSDVNKMTTKEMKRDVLVMARKNPSLFLQVASDENVILRNKGILAVENKILKLSKDNRYFMWGSNDRKLMTVPFDEHPYTALAHWFKTDEGMEVYKQVEKMLS
tara:strand:+ start:510 stop:1334 length:825 start_codon:yes stop_codon:yes gene_type:complete